MAIFVPHSNLAKTIGQQVIETGAASVRDLLNEIIGRIGKEKWDALKRVSILVNGRNIARLEGLDTPLGPNDQVWMIVPSAGG